MYYDGAANCAGEKGGTYCALSPTLCLTCVVMDSLHAGQMICAGSGPREDISGVVARGERVASFSWR
jgi:hypothetical protein